MIKTCRICFDNKECLSFPCCDNHFDICQTCLNECPRTCPQCRKSFRVETALVSVKKRTCDCLKTLVWLSYLTVIAFIVLTYIITIKRIGKCEDQPCADIIYNGDGRCDCGIEFVDPIAFSMLVVVFLMVSKDCFFPTVIMNSYESKEEFKSSLITYIVPISSLIIFYIVQNKYDEYDKDNYHLKFIHTWTFIAIMYAAIPLGSWLICKMFSYLFGCVPNTPGMCCKMEEYVVSTPTIVATNAPPSPQLTTINIQPENNKVLKQVDCV